MVQLTGTFLDEISHDIPSQNWGRAEWDRDFAAMASVGIDTVIMIRCGHRQWLTYPSAVLQQAEGCFAPDEDLVDMFLDLAVNRALAHKHGLRCWSNIETFDRDMPIKFLPIKWEKLRRKLRAAEAAGMEKAITFEFSHFLSPNSMYASAHGLFDRYREWRGACRT